MTAAVGIKCPLYIPAWPIQLEHPPPGPPAAAGRRPRTEVLESQEKVLRIVSNQRAEHPALQTSALHVGAIAVMAT